MKTKTKVNEAWLPFIDQTVGYYDDHALHFGTLLEVGRKWAKVLHPTRGRKKVAIEDLSLRMLGK